MAKPLPPQWRAAYEFLTPAERAEYEELTRLRSYLSRKIQTLQQKAWGKYRHATTYVSTKGTKDA